jgi:hypothetical protein
MSKEFDLEIVHIKKIRHKYISQRNAHVLLPLDIKRNHQYSVFSIIKNATYCMDLQKDCSSVSKIYDTLEGINDYRLSIIFTALALTVLDKKNIHSHGLEICISGTKDIVPLTGNTDYTDNTGCMNYSFNILMMSNAQDQKNFLLVFPHEVIHNLQHHLNFKIREDFLESIKASKEIFKGMTVNDKGYSFIKHTFDRIESDGVSYSSPKEILEEYLADTAKILVYSKLYPTEKTNILKVYKPIIDYFDNNFVPKLEEYISKNPYKKILQLPEKFKQEVQPSDNNKDKTLQMIKF